MEDTKLRCPYCGEVFPPQKSPRCPKCRRTMIIPLSLRMDKEERQRRRLLLRSLDRERNRGPMGTAQSVHALLRRPILLGGIMVVLLALGYLLMRKSEHAVITIAQETPEEITARNLRVLRTALEIFRMDCGRYPTTRETMRALVRNDGKIPDWDGPYIIALKPDIWRNPYAYACVQGEVVLFSSGPDGMQGTGDDIPSPPPDESLLAPPPAPSAAATNAPPESPAPAPPVAPAP